MGTRLFHLSGMAAKERFTIRLMRGMKEAAFPDSLATDFDELRARACASGMIIQELTSTFVGPDEMRLIAWLTAFQRERVHLLWDKSSELEESVRTCAKALDCHGIRLDYRHVVRTDDRSVSTQSDHYETRAIHDGTTAIRLALAARSPQFRALDIIEKRGAVRTGELSAMGISRQIISVMCKRGLIRRVRHGMYIAAA